LELFPNYDILFIDYFGQGLNHTPSTLLGKLTYHLFNVDMNATKLGSSDEVDVINFVKAAIKESSLFEKLLIDGCWPSIKLVIKKIARDPSLICGKQPPSSPCPFITHRESFQNGACSLVEKLAHIKLSEIQSIEDKIQFLKIPILFFQSAKDCYCTEKQFENIWQSVSSDKIAILTPHFHGRNYLKDAITFQKTSHIFFEHPVQDFMSILLNS